jgi:hypothetical protein
MKVLATWHVIAADDGGNVDLDSQTVRLGRPEDVRGRLR